MWRTIVEALPGWKTLIWALFTFLIPYSTSKLFGWFHQKERMNRGWDEENKSTVPNPPLTTNSSNSPSKPWTNWPPTDTLTSQLQVNLNLLSERLGCDSDYSVREFNIGGSAIRAAIVSMSKLSDSTIIQEHILKPLMLDLWKSNVTDMYARTDFKVFIKDHVLPLSKINEAELVHEVIEKVITGSTALLIEGISGCLILGTSSTAPQNFEEPSSESLVRGPKIGFVNSLDENISLLRSRASDPNLRMLSFQVGERNKKNLVISYVEGIADPNLVDEVKRRIEKIKIDDVLESGYIDQLIEDNFMSPFPQVQSTERPDRVIGSLLEGRVAILTNGSSYVSIVPVTFSMLLQSPEDYYVHWIPSSLVRLLRFFAAFVALLGPAIYISFLSFHQGLIPTKLAISMAGTREGVPFPPFLEALIMEVVIEILREAGLRLPKPVGQTVGLVGGLVIGQAAVEAGIASPLMVIVVSLTAISSFAIPQYDAGIALRMLRFVAMLSAAALGIYGVVMFTLFLSIHFVKIKNFGIPYASPFVPYRPGDWKDLFIRAPLSSMKKRPRMMHPQDQTRQGNHSLKGKQSHDPSE
ncbi:spore germination protein [Paenibacillus sp. CGMCC 1.16610]|uniref:Spore germination protein n=1 Tax=Paenibacillus anseongense TaxID=2682845 RepID=A0ABW9UBQ8_9BACL|nr:MULTISPECIES: spore germination protein [Paenibacillus]MBA2943666.1 spore germination protein [Paenibacillus sp. CGMCC 1.16610]MVQ37572.1 spore germination protein [Paenibacillus anseongense]